MGGLLYDSSVYIDSFRRGDTSLLLARQASVKGKLLPVYLSSVVLSELFAGAVDPRAKKLLLKVENDFQAIGRIIAPNKNDWSLSGQTLLKIGQKHGFEKIKLSRMTNDCLIAISARRFGLTVATTNVRNFEVISEFQYRKTSENFKESGLIVSLHKP